MTRSQTPAAMQLRGAATIQRAVQLLLRTAPFYAEILSQWNARMDDACSTCGVCWDGSRIQFRWSPQFFSRPELSVPQAAAVMQHEVHHVLFGHVFWKTDASTDRRAQLIAAETVANEFIHPSFPLPGKPIHYHDFHGMAPLQSTLVRYRLLTSQPRSPDLEEPEASDDHSGWESIAAAGTVAKIAIAAATERALSKAGNSADQTTSRLMKAVAAEGQAATSRPAAKPLTVAGSKAGNHVERVRSTTTPWLNWPGLLSHLPPGPDTIQETWSSPPRRRPELAGFVPGRHRVTQPQTLLVAIDVSGSMSAEILGWIKHEVRALASLCRVAVCEIDESLQRAQRLFDDATLLPAELDDQAHGRGGTAFDAAFAPDLLAWAGNGENLQGILYFTDGFGPEPTRAPHIPVVWVLSDEFGRVKVPAAWGMVIAPDGTIQRPLVGSPVAAGTRR